MLLNIPKLQDLSTKSINSLVDDPFLMMQFNEELNETINYMSDVMEDLEKLYEIKEHRKKYGAESLIIFKDELNKLGIDIYSNTCVSDMEQLIEKYHEIAVESLMGWLSNIKDRFLVAFKSFDSQINKAKDLLAKAKSIENIDYKKLLDEEINGMPKETIEGILESPKKIEHYLDMIKGYYDKIKTKDMTEEEAKKFKENIEKVISEISGIEAFIFKFSLFIFIVTLILTMPPGILIVVGLLLPLLKSTKKVKKVVGKDKEKDYAYAPKTISNLGFTEKDLQIKNIEEVIKKLDNVGHELEKRIKINNLLNALKNLFKFRDVNINKHVIKKEFAASMSFYIINQLFMFCIYSTLTYQNILKKIIEMGS